ncbi:BRCT domain-containing protein [Vibrio sp. D431a]|uniref:BRCT domain-containing protein n=1 Tax=Vibrio sp. D431a TaxID=2837388 RepID=UPI002552686B|nr:BRCT domain-containing protein [Vibrio sp. D431a]MDK9790163.1 DNA ligase [Vibrio sp. D431a]
MTELTFSGEQLEIISEFEVKLDLDLIKNTIINFSFSKLTNEDQLAFLKIANACYRSGYPIMESQQYDDFNMIFALNNPDHPYVTSVEEEVMNLGKKVKLPQKMLSTDKAYSEDEIKKWLKKILKASKSLGLNPDAVEIRVTPKLDGFASYDDAKLLYTRGDGAKGQDISRAFERGLTIAKDGSRGLGAGEIVTHRDYYDKYLKEHFENTRNIQSAVIAPKNINPLVQKAIDDKACVFYPFALLDSWTGLHTELMANFRKIVDEIWNSVPYDVDGVILEATSPEIKEKLGATRKFHRWQIAFKINEDAEHVESLAVTPQCARTGRITPVVELVPTKISGATLTRATAHHYKNVLENGIGKGAILEVVRSGLVIPTINSVISSVDPEIPTECPSCSSTLAWDEDSLYCLNKMSCPAQIENTLLHFFKTLNNNEGFGDKTVQKLVQNGVNTISKVYALTQTDFMSFGFGEKVSKNLEDALHTSRSTQIEDWRFLAAFGVSRLGLGNSEKLMKVFSLEEVFNLSLEKMVELDGFGEKGSPVIIGSLNRVKDEFFNVHKLGFSLSTTPKGVATMQSSPIAGKTIVFTGTMLHDKRSNMEKEAKSLGAKVSKSVSSKTDLLVAGNNVGANKTNSAKENGVKIISEDEYLNLVRSDLNQLSD